MLDLHRLALLYEFSVRGTVTAVAGALGYSASTVSQQLTALEREAGAQLLVPAGRGLRLTPRGRELAAMAAQMLELEERARSVLGSGDVGVGPVRLAAIPSAMHLLASRYFDGLQERYPRLRVEISEVAAHSAVEEVVARGFDLAIVDQYPGRARELRAGLAVATLALDRVRIATHPRLKVDSVGGLRDAAWVSEPRGTVAHDWLTQLCREAGFEPDIRFEATHPESRIRLIAHGQAVGLVTDMALQQPLPALRLMDLSETPCRELLVLSRRASSAQPDLEAVRLALMASFAPAGDPAA